MLSPTLGIRSVKFRRGRRQGWIYFVGRRSYLLACGYNKPRFIAVRQPPEYTVTVEPAAQISLLIAAGNHNYYRGERQGEHSRINNF